MPRSGHRQGRRAGRKRSSVHLPTRQREQKALELPRMLARPGILMQLQDLIVACEELFAQHGEACTCESCCVVTNMVGSLRVFRLLLEIS